MNRAKRVKTLVLLCASALSLIATTGWPNEGVFPDARTGDYLIRYKGGAGVIEEVIFYSKAKVDPEVKSRVMLMPDGSIGYSFKVRNVGDAKQHLTSIMFDASDADGATQSSSLHWDPYVFEDVEKSIHLVSWSSILIPDSQLEAATLRKGLAPGSEFAEFFIGSRHLPGVGVMRLSSDPSETTGYPDDGPDYDTDIGKKVYELETHNYVPRHAAIPLIHLGTPFDVVETLSSMQAHIKKDLIQMRLVEPGFAAELDRLLQSAIDASKVGATKALAGKLKDFRQAIQKASPGVDVDEAWMSDDGKGGNPNRLIDRLAARVLFFDIKYIEKHL